jgi:UPF0755 protein
VVRTKQGESAKAKTGRHSSLCPFPIALSFVLAALSFVACGSPRAPQTGGRRVEVSIRPELSVRALADTLAAKRVIGNRALFHFYSWYYNYAPRIRPGRYRLPVGTGERRALKLLSGEEPALVMVTIPEGYTMQQVAATLAEHGICQADSFLAVCADTSLLRELAVFAPTAEGYLFPETYEFLANSPPRDVVRRLLHQFSSVFSELRTSTPNPRSLTPAQTVTLASIVEGEAQVPAEFPRVAGVFMNRLRRRIPLQSCATVEYLLPERKGILTVADTRIESPYNTYLHAGLPPGPICNPGRRALAAVLSPERHNYFFFVARGDGTHIFSRTLAEHADAMRRVSRDD